MIFDEADSMEREPAADSPERDEVPTPAPPGASPADRAPGDRASDPPSARAVFADFDSSAYLYEASEPIAVFELPDDLAPLAPLSLVNDDQPPADADLAAIEWSLKAGESFADEVDEVDEVDEASATIGANGEIELLAGDRLLESIERIPDKMAFKIGEAAEMIGVKQYVLRYWESEFDQLRPKKSKNNQRVYTRRDVETGLMIKKLLYVDRFSIEGARAALRQLKREVREEKSIKAAAGAHEAAVKGLRALIVRIDRARERFARPV